MRTPKITLYTAVAAVAAMLLAMFAPTGQSTTDMDIQSRVGQLEVRVSSLERSVERLSSLHSAAAQSPADAELPAPDRDMRVMKFESLELAAPRAEALAEAKELHEEADMWEERANDLERRLARLRGRDSSYGDDDGDESRRLGELLGEYRREARRLRGEALRLEREANEPRQIITGWDGNREVTLKATRDLSGVLDEIQPGDFLTWDGRRIYLSDMVARWQVRDIEQVAPPEGFNDRSESSGD